MKELVKPVKEITLLNAEGYCESNGACQPQSGTCNSYGGCGTKSYNADTDSSDIIF